MAIAPDGPFYSLDALSDAFRDGSAKPSQVMRAHLDRIAKYDGKLGAFETVFEEEAMEAAEAAEKAIATGHRIGPLHGMPFALKDICEFEGRRTTWGSMAFKDRISDHTGTLARRLTAAGGIVIGKTKTVECAFGGWGTNQVMGTPRNPWDMQDHRIPGGSSSGSGVSLAAGFAVCAVGTDTGGSVRLPAAFCGITGLKVTEGRLPTDGIMPLSHTLDTPGPMARSIRDTLIMYLVMEGWAGCDIDRDRDNGKGFYSEIDKGVAGLRLGQLDESERANCTAEILDGYDEAVEHLARLGAQIEIFSAPDSYREMTEVNGNIIAVEGYFHHGARYEDDSLPLDGDVRARMRGGRDITAQQYVTALQNRVVLKSRFDQAMGGLDAVLTPSTTMIAPKLAETDQAIAPSHFSRPFNYMGMCALSVPGSLTPAGMPTALQVVGRPHTEAMILRIGAALERAQPSVPGPSLD